MLIGKAFHRRGPATPNTRSPRHVQVRGTKHVTASTDVYAYCVLPVHLNNEIFRFSTGLFEIFNQNNSIYKVEIMHVKLYRKLIYAESMTS